MRTPKKHFEKGILVCILHFSMFFFQLLYDRICSFLMYSTVFIHFVYDTTSFIAYKTKYHVTVVSSWFFFIVLLTDKYHFVSLFYLTDPFPAFKSWQEDSESGEAQLSPQAGRMTNHPLEEDCHPMLSHRSLDFGQSQRFLHDPETLDSSSKALSFVRYVLQCSLVGVVAVTSGMKIQLLKNVRSFLWYDTNWKPRSDVSLHSQLAVLHTWELPS